MNKSRSKKVTLFIRCADADAMSTLLGQCDDQQGVMLKVPDPRLGEFGEGGKNYVRLYADQGRAEGTWTLVLFTAAWAAILPGVIKETAQGNFDLRNWATAQEVTITY